MNQGYSPVPRGFNSLARINRARVPLALHQNYEDKKEGVEMNSLFTSTLTAGARAAVPSAAHTTSKTATKRWFYANFYAVDEATGALIE